MITLVNAISVACAILSVLVLMYNIELTERRNETERQYERAVHERKKVLAKQTGVMDKYSEDLSRIIKGIETMPHTEFNDGYRRGLNEAFRAIKNYMDKEDDEEDFL